MTYQEIACPPLCDDGVAAIDPVHGSWPLPIANLVLDPASPIHLYEQIVRKIRALVVAGELPPGTKMPTSRELAAALGVTRNTVGHAYGHLVAAGLLVSNRRRGTHVAGNWFEACRRARSRAEAEPATTAKAWANPSSASAGPAGRPAIASHSGSRGAAAPDPLLYPRRQLSRLLAEEFRRPPVADSHGALRRGQHRLQIALAAYLRQARGVYCVPPQIVPVSGLESAITLVCRAMLGAGDRVLVEDPSFDAVATTFRAYGASVQPLATDAAGPLTPADGGSRPKLVFVSPSVSFPYGRQTAYARRTALIDYAHNSGAAIFECDTGAELSYTSGRLQAIQGLAAQQNVIYFGSFTETLGLHLRASYLVVPEALADRVHRGAEQLGREPGDFILNAVARFIEEERNVVHVKGLRAIYAKRLELTVKACHEYLHGTTVIEPEGGQSLAVLVRGALDERSLEDAALAAGLPVAALGRFHLGANPMAGLVIGFAAMGDRAIEPSIRRLGAILAMCRSPKAA